MAPPCIIELNDADIRVSRGDRPLLRSPGIAVIQGNELKLGEQAAQVAHLHPRNTYNRFWSALSQEPWPDAAGTLRHNADLAWHHLRLLHEQAGKPEQVIFAVPGSFSSAQLSLLLGISQSCSFKAAGLVDAAVAAAASVAGAGRYQHIELQLHQAVLTRIDVGNEVQRQSVDVVEGSGILAFHDAAAELVADAFIQQSRFDPLHRAETEQAVYDQLPRCLAALQSQHEILLDIAAGRSRQQARVTRDGMVARLQREYAAIVQRLEPGRMALLGDRAAAMPGLAAACGAAPVLGEDAVRRGCLAHLERIQSGGPNLNFVTRLPAPEAAALRSADPEAVTARRPARDSRAATHLLHGYLAYPVSDRTLYLSARGSIGTAAQPTSSCSITGNGMDIRITPLADITIYVDGERVDGPRRLAAGDKISFAGSDTVYSLISTTHPDAT
ncbi:MAG: hypothetical protein HYR49_08615 [Gammaproteobacteria bacterium]|nr:hypothetical protein [Gammaproteobacteria bacterium]